MALSDIHDRVRRALAKGTSQDAMIVSAVRAAARQIEQNRTWQYMKKVGTATFDLESEFPNMIAQPPRLRRMRLVRFVIDDQFYTVRRGLELFNVNYGEGLPQAYELDGTARIVFNKIPDEAYTIEMFYDQFTAWPTEDTATNWLIENGEEALFAQTMLSLSGDNRDPRQRQNLISLRDEAMRSMLIADEELAEADYANEMQFVPEGGLDDEDVTG